jgi:hypothetical protein
MVIMRAKKFLLITLILYASFFASGNILTASGTVIADQDESSVNITILNAYYADLDQGGIENDIFVEFTLNLTLQEDDGYFLFYFTLVLPSGTEYYYRTSFSVSQSTNYYGVLYFYNYATEAGWYEIKSLGVLFQEDDIKWYFTSYIFDPPGGTGGDDPQVMMMVLVEDVDSIVLENRKIIRK